MPQAKWSSGLRTAAIGAMLGLAYVLWIVTDTQTYIEPSDAQNGTFTHAYNVGVAEVNVTRVKRLPGAIIIGSKKGGTTMLATFLGLNPHIRVTGSEMHFFDRDIAYKQGYGQYLRYLAAVGPEEVALEKTPKYFVYEPAAARIHAMNNSVKLLLILRDPVKRLISDYDHERTHPDKNLLSPHKEERLHFRRIEKDNSLEELVFSADGGLNMTYEPVIASMYDIHVQRYLGLFALEQLLVLDGERFNRDPLPILRRCEAFLGVPSLIRRDMMVLNEDKGYYCVANEECPVRRGKKHVTYPDAVINRLQELYAPHIRRLVALLGHGFDWSDKYL